MYKFIGTCADVINWYTFADNLLKIPDPIKPVRNSNIEEAGHIFAEYSDPESQLIMKNWFDCNYNLDSAKWVNYESTINYGSDITTKFGRFVGVRPLKSWVTRLDPGCTAPYHPDLESDLAPHLSKGKIVRYTCHMCDDGVGAAFFLEDHFFYNQPNGNVYRWDNWLSWHGGVNAGTKPHWLFSFWGLEPR